MKHIPKDDVLAKAQEISCREESYRSAFTNPKIIVVSEPQSVVNCTGRPAKQQLDVSIEDYEVLTLIFLNKGKE